MTDTMLTAAGSALAGWIWWVDRKVSAHEEVINKVDELVKLLLEDRLGSNRATPRPSLPDK